MYKEQLEEICCLNFAVQYTAQIPKRCHEFGKKVADHLVHETDAYADWSMQRFYERYRCAKALSEIAYYCA